MHGGVVVVAFRSKTTVHTEGNSAAASAATAVNQMQDAAVLLMQYELRQATTGSSKEKLKKNASLSLVYRPLQEKKKKARKRKTWSTCEYRNMLQHKLVTCIEREEISG